VREVNGIKIVTRKVEGVEAKSLREMADRLRQKYGFGGGGDSVPTLATTRSRC